MWAILWQTIKDKKTSLLIYSLASVVLDWLFVSIFPTIQAQSVNLETLLKFYPESLMKAFNVNLAQYTTFGGYFATEQFSFTWPLMIIFLIVGFAAGSLAGEIEKGTMELLLSQPISRVKIFLGKYFSGLAILLTFSLISNLVVYPLAKAYNFSINFENVFALTILCTIFSLAIFSMAMLFSAIFSDKGKVYFATGGILILMYVINIVAMLKDNFQDLKYFSFFYYFNPSNALVSHEINHWAYWVFIGISVSTAIIAALWFARRNIDN